MNRITSHSLVETTQLAEQWLTGLNSRADDATIVALNGNLGSGKTTFVKSVAHALGVEENITSPTFVLMKKYELENLGGAIHLQKFKRLIHIDAYRLENGTDLGALQFESLIADPGNLILIEWADNVKSGLPENINNIDFEYVSENERKISYT